MYAFLKSPEGGALPDDQLVIMVDESATRNKIIKNMEEVFGRAGKDDMILFYFSGHGEKEGLLPIDYNGYDNVLEHKTISKILNKTKAPLATAGGLVLLPLEALLSSMGSERTHFQSSWNTNLLPSLPSK